MAFGPDNPHSNNPLWQEAYASGQATGSDLQLPPSEVYKVAVSRELGACTFSTDPAVDGVVRGYLGGVQDRLIQARHRSYQGICMTVTNTLVNQPHMLQGFVEGMVGEQPFIDRDQRPSEIYRFMRDQQVRYAHQMGLFAMALRRWPQTAEQLPKVSWPSNPEEYQGFVDGFEGRVPTFNLSDDYIYNQEKRPLRNYPGYPKLGKQPEVNFGTFLKGVMLREAAGDHKNPKKFVDSEARDALFGSEDYKALVQRVREEEGMSSLSNLTNVLKDRSLLFPEIQLKRRLFKPLD